MKIEVKENVFYDDELEVQSDELNQWLNDEALPKRADSTPEEDVYARPCRWVINMTTCFVVITREYIHQNYSWAMKDEKVIITSNN